MSHGSSTAISIIIIRYCIPTRYQRAQRQCRELQSNAHRLIFKVEREYLDALKRGLYVCCTMLATYQINNS